MNEIKETALSLVKKLKASGYESYVVGGCVRDELLCREVYDYDITTAAKPNEIKEVFAEYQIFETGIKHGTVSVKIGEYIFEVTTFRTDGDYSDHRKPDSISFVSSLKEDLNRRDFTINALAYSDEEGVIDYFCGREDLENKLIRAVGDPNLRFKEDALRILRGLRFASTLGFEIEEETYKAMMSNRQYLQSISKERIFSEMTKTLVGQYAHIVLDKYKEIVFEIIPELKPCFGFDQKSLSHNLDVYAHTLKAISLAEKRTPIIIWSLLFHDIAKPLCFYIGDDGFGHTYGHMELSAEIAKNVLKRLKAPIKFTDEVFVLVFNHDREIGDTKYSLKLFLNKYGLEYAKDLLVVKSADMFAHSKYGIDKYLRFKVAYENNLEKIVNGNECYSFDALKINGNDLRALGFQDKDIGRMKEKLLDAVMQNPELNSKQDLIELVKSYL